MLNISKIPTNRVLALLSLVFMASFNPIISKPAIGKDKYYVFFDLGDVLLESDHLKAFMDNKGTFIKYLFKHGVPSSHYLKRRMFELMDYQTKLPRGTAVNDNMPMPQIMCDWLKGKVSSQELVDIVTNIQVNDPFFKSKKEAQVLISMVKQMLPENLVNIHRTTKLLKTFQACCKHDANRVCILSNWDSSSLQLLKAKFPEIFSQINDKQIIFSGELGCNKPDPIIYALAANQVGVHPCHCILIDDQAINVQAARKCGWKGIVHTDKNETAEILDEFYGFACNI